MLRNIIEEAQSLANKCCPLPSKYTQLTTSRAAEDIRLNQRLEGFSYLYMIIWTFIQLVIFVILMILFYGSKENYFMRDKDCCKAQEYLTRTNNDLPLKDCSNQACPFENYGNIFSGALALNDNRPRTPHNGDFSQVFQYQQQWWCCNLDANTDECCNKLPYGPSCGAIMWFCGFSAVCAMLMTQVTLQGFYSFCSRRNAYWTLLSVIPGMLLRLLLFFLLFYFFFGFMFIFIFFWIPMMICDNPYAFEWWKFGYLYVYFWFENLGWILSNGFTHWDGNMDFDTLIATHTSLSVLVDAFFAIIYVLLSKIKDNKGQPYFHLTFFKL